MFIDILNVFFIYFSLQVYEVYHFSQASTALFRSYIDLLLKIKQESSGWPTDCQTEEQKSQYIQTYLDKEGVLLDATNIMKNPCRRQVAKLPFNSFWGRSVCFVLFIYYIRFIAFSNDITKYDFSFLDGA